MMKKLGVFLIVMCVSVGVMGQNKLAYRHYITKKTVTELKYGDVTLSSAPKAVSLCPDYKLLRCNVSFSGGVATIDFHGLETTVPTNCKDDGTVVIHSRQISTKDQYFIDFRRSSVVPYRKPVKILFTSFNFGLMSVPFKLRPSLAVDSTRMGGISNVPIEASTGVNIGLYGGYSIGRSHVSFKGINTFTFSIGGFFGPSAIKLEEGRVYDFDKFKSEIDGNKSVTLPAVTYGLTVIGAMNNFGIVACLGFDSPIGTGRGYWIYSEKPWFGLGIIGTLPF
jgi:hypothetical protein